MNHLLFYLLIFASAVATGYAQVETPQQSLNQYVVFLNQSVGVLIQRFQMMQAYQADVAQYPKQADHLLRLPSSGPLEAYYYQKALAGNGLTATEKQRLTASAQLLWQLLTKLDQTAKALETYVRLKAYQQDNFKQSDALTKEIVALINEFSSKKKAFYDQIQRIYRRYQPYLPSDPYLTTEKEMEQVLLSQQQLLDSLPYYLHEESYSLWPTAQVQQSMLVDEEKLPVFGKAKSVIDYPASDAINSFTAELRSMQALKRRAVDENTFAAQQSAQHGNAVYLSLLKQYNQGLLASYHTFVTYSQSIKQLLNQPLFSPVVKLEPLPSVVPGATPTVPFQDKPHQSFSVKRAVRPATRATLGTLNDYVEYINESLRQMHRLQVLLRNYQTSAEYYRDPSRSSQRAGLTYSHAEYNVPVSTYQLLLNSSGSIPQPYRAAMTTQADVLLRMLQEMDGLSIELIAYTTEKRYLYDRLLRSDAILDRYAYLFDTFDQKKEQLYTDLRRIYESFPAADPTSSWIIAGNALQKTLDDNKAIMFGVKSFLGGEATRLPLVRKAEAGAKQLITDEYQNLKGLKRFGRSNGLCPYSPYEDLAANSIRFAELAQNVKSDQSVLTTHPYESFYYFYNNELVYQYNKFCELAKVGLLKAINQPDMFAFHRVSVPKLPDSISLKTGSLANSLVVKSKPTNGNKPGNKPIVEQANQATSPLTDQATSLQRDTVYINQSRVDTVYLDRTEQRTIIPSLNGFAANNMVLLLDVSGSMDSPAKLPLLKRSIKSLLTLLRPEDQLSIVVYSGKARVVLKPTSGTKSAEIARIIDELQSDGDTDGNGGLRLAYKVANKQYLRAGNNRIILATDGEFPVSDEVLQLIGENARQDVYLTVFTFGRNALTGQNLKKLSELGHGRYAHITTETADLQLILEAQAKPK